MTSDIDLGKTGLVLSGGGTHGFAHIGVLKVLDRKGISPDVIIGSSAGAIIGTMVAAGKTAMEIETYFRTEHTYGFMDPVLTKAGFFRGEKMVSKLLAFCGVKYFEDLKIPLVVNAMNINTGKERAFSKGLLARAINASIAFPGVFIPKKIESELYVDGGVYNPVPVHLLPRVDTAIVVDVSKMIDKITDRSSAVQILSQSVLLMQKRLVNYELELYSDGKRIIMMTPDVNKYHFFEFKKKHMEDMVVAGEREAKKVFRQVKKDLAL